MSASRTLVPSILRSLTESSLRLPTLVGLLLLAATELAAGQTATQLVRFSVIAQSRAEAAPVARPISMTAPKGDVSTSTLTLATNDANLKVTASIDQRVPAGTSLSIAVGNGSSGRVASVQQLGTDERDVLTGMSAKDATRIPVSYRVASAGDSAPRDAAQRIVTYTIVGAP